MRIVAADKWIPCDNIVLEDNAKKAVQTNRNVLVVAGPGAGKTELLAQKACYLFQTNICKDPLKILAISFKKDAAENLKKRVDERCGREFDSRFVSLTYDAFFKSIVDHFRFALPEDIRPEASYLVEDQDVIVAAFAKAGFNNDQGWNKSRTRKYYEDVISSVKLPFSKSGLGEKVWRLLLKGFDDKKPTLTFKMISILAEYIISTNPKIKKGIQLTYKYVFLDEFQDTTDLQYSIVKECFLPSGSILTAVGDNKQRIMLWAGARKTVFKDFENDFNAETQKLLMNHRSAPRLVDLQGRMYASLNENGQTVKPSNKWNSDDGEISLLITQNEQEEAVEIAETISQKILSGTEPSKICILCKQKPETYVGTIIPELSQRGICARIETDYQDFLKEPVVEILSAFLRLAIDIKRPDDWEILLLAMSELRNIDSYSDNESYYDMQNAVEKEIEYLKSMMPRVSSKAEFNDLIEHLIRFLGIKQIKAVFQCYEQGNYLNELLNRYQELVWKDFEAVDSNWMQALENFEGKHSVPIMTIHKSKGLEFEFVCFVGLEDSAFWNFRSQPEEDRCAFFVALSRAKKEVMFTFSYYRDRGRYSYQSHNVINEFFELLQAPGVAKIIKLLEDADI